MPNEHVEKAVQRQENSVLEEFKKCIRRFGPNVTESGTQSAIFNHTTKRLMCPAIWDGASCWEPAPANSLVQKPCPAYVIGALDSFATKNCTQNGTWYIKDDKPWTNYSNCTQDEMVTIYVNSSKLNISEELIDAFQAAKIISETGYIVSLISLIIALCIMLLIKKLHCARNIIHMNLFASFILRALIIISKEIFFQNGIGTTNDVIVKNGSSYFNTDITRNNYECKLITSLMQYFTTANYSWILMEGVYLNNLIFRALLSDSSRNLIYYVVFGWGLPVLVVVPWIIARLSWEDTYCWTTNDNQYIYLIIALPIMVSVFINLVLFVLISAVLYCKLRSPVNKDSGVYQKWAKSTLVLVPLFGVNYAFFLILYFVGDMHNWLIIDTFFGSFQGFFVAFLYCFLNGEVKAEVKPYICHFLTIIATHRFFGYCFPCREMYLRSAVGRQSVCTTMSCSSLYTNGIMHRNSKSKWDLFPKSRNSMDNKTIKDHICLNSSDKHCRLHSKSIQNDLNSAAVKNHHYHSAETALCFEPNRERNHSESITIEEEITMLSKRYQV